MLFGPVDNVYLSASVFTPRKSVLVVWFNRLSPMLTTDWTLSYTDECTATAASTMT